MSVLLVAAVLAATASIIAIVSVAYILISLRRSRRLLASRIGRQPLALVMIAGESARRRPPKAQSIATRRQLRWQPLMSS